MKEYKSPILTSVFNVLGGITLLIGIYLMVLAFTTQIGAGAIMAAGFIFSAVIDFGLAQMIDFLGKSAHYSEQTAMLLLRQQMPGPRPGGSAYSGAE
jgi:hypothetical protein